MIVNSDNIILVGSLYLIINNIFVFVGGEFLNFSGWNKMG